jgi:hypothetical protein
MRESWEHESEAVNKKLNSVYHLTSDKAGRLEAEFSTTHVKEIFHTGAE